MSIGTIPEFTAHFSLSSPNIKNYFAVNINNYLVTLSKYSITVNWGGDPLIICPPCEECDPVTHTKICSIWRPVQQECAAVHRRCCWPHCK